MKETKDDDFEIIGTDCVYRISDSELKSHACVMKRTICNCDDLIDASEYFKCNDCKDYDNVKDRDASSCVNCFSFKDSIACSFTKRIFHGSDLTNTEDYFGCREGCPGFNKEE
jgi:hypothetical protein